MPRRDYRRDPRSTDKRLPTHSRKQTHPITRGQHRGRSISVQRCHPADTAQRAIMGVIAGTAPAPIRSVTTGTCRVAPPLFCHPTARARSSRRSLGRHLTNTRVGKCTPSDRSRSQASGRIRGVRAGGVRQPARPVRAGRTPMQSSRRIRSPSSGRGGYRTVDFERTFR